MHNITGRANVNVLISNYTNKHITFNKAVHVGHLEPSIEDMQQILEILDQLQHTVLPQKLMVEKVEPDIFKPPWHKLQKDIKAKLKKLLKEYQSQLTQDETIIGTRPLTKMMIDTRDSKQVSQKP